MGSLYNQPRQLTTAEKNRNSIYGGVRAIGSMIGPWGKLVEGVADIAEQLIEEDDYFTAQGKTKWNKFDAGQGISKLLTGNENMLAQIQGGDYAGAGSSLMGNYNTYSNIRGSGNNELNKVPNVAYDGAYLAEDGLVIGNMARRGGYVTDDNFADSLNYNPNTTNIQMPELLSFNKPKEINKPLFENWVMPLKERSMIAAQTIPEDEIQKPLPNVSHMMNFAGSKTYTSPSNRHTSMFVPNYDISLPVPRILPKEIEYSREEDKIQKRPTPYTDAAKKELQDRQGYTTYYDMLDRNQKRKDIETVSKLALLGGQYAVSALRKPSDKLRFKPIQAPQLTSPEYAMKAGGNETIKRILNADVENRKRRGGMYDANIGSSANAYRAAKEVEVQAAMADNQIQNEQEQLNYQTALQNEQGRLNVDQANMQAQIAENAAIGAERSALLGGIGDIATNWTNFKIQAEQMGYDVEELERLMKDMSPNERAQFIMEMKKSTIHHGNEEGKIKRGLTQK